MADGKQWFKVWHTILTDPGMDDLHNQTIGVWVRLGALVSSHGEKGTVSLSLSQFKKRCHLIDADDVTIQAILQSLKTINLEVIICNGLVSVTFKKWHKYQVDNSAERVAKHRENVTMQEEKRREENKKRIRIRKEENIIKHKHGEYQHVRLTDDEYKKLEERFNSRLPYLIEKLDKGIEQKGYKYKSHYLTIIDWSEREGNRPQEETPAQIAVRLRAEGKIK